MIELQVLQALLNKDTWIAYRKYVDKKQLTKELSTLLDILDTHFSKRDDSLTVPEFEIICETSGKIDKTHRAVLETLGSCHVRPELVEDLLKAYKRKSVLSQLALASYDASEGRKDIATVHKLIEQLDEQQELTTTEELSFTTDDLEVLYAESYAQPGLRWRLDTLNHSLGSLRKGDFGFVFARPETGKTTFLASELTFMAEQATRPVLWINNEEQSNKVMLRCYQAYLGLTTAELASDIPWARHKFQEGLQGRLKIFNGVTSTAQEIEQLCQSINPELIIFDQIDKIKGFDDDRDDLRLGAIYQWARELAKTYGPVIGITQADGTGENVRWLNMNNVANAKTSKQAEADWILGIGKIHDASMEYIRFLHLCKNKLQGDPDTLPEMRHGRMEVKISPEIARYEDIQYNE
jgi:hypothetical protein